MTTGANSFWSNVLIIIGILILVSSCATMSQIPTMGGIGTIGIILGGSAVGIGLMMRVKTP